MSVDEKKGSRAERESGGADACVPAFRITSRRWRSVIIVTPLRYLVAFGTNDPILPPFVRSRPCSRARPGVFPTTKTSFCSLERRRRRRRRRRRSSPLAVLSARFGGVILISHYRFADRVPAVISTTESECLTIVRRECLARECAEDAKFGESSTIRRRLVAVTSSIKMPTIISPAVPAASSGSGCSR